MYEEEPDKKNPSNPKKKSHIKAKLAFVGAVFVGGYAAGHLTGDELQEGAANFLKGTGQALQSGGQEIENTGNKLQP